MKVGDLVEYVCRYGDERRCSGIVYRIDYDYDYSMPFRVRWQDHTDSIRDWYSRTELRKVNENR